jgi:phage repressor protein C with HTH and peptisase S24 domain
MFFFPIIIVDGVSMCPTYQDRQLLLATRLFRYNKLKAGRVYVFHSPSGEVVIKRLAYEKDGMCYFLGDNEEESFDSRYYGYVPKSMIIAKIVFTKKKKEVE